MITHKMSLTCLCGSLLHEAIKKIFSFVVMFKNVHEYLKAGGSFSLFSVFASNLMII